MENLHNKPKALPLATTLGVVAGFKTCDFCYGYGVWIGEWIPILPDETGFASSDPCPHCGAENDFLNEDNEDESQDGEDESIMVEGMGEISSFSLAFRAFREEDEDEIKKGEQCAESQDIPAEIIVSPG